jgi:hypothetical protein
VAAMTAHPGSADVQYIGCFGLASIAVLSANQVILIFVSEKSVIILQVHVDV